MDDQMEGDDTDHEVTRKEKIELMQEIRQQAKAERTENEILENLYRERSILEARIDIESKLRKEALVSYDD
jgi:hypothetical protein